MREETRERWEGRAQGSLGDDGGGCVVYSDFHMLFKSMCYFSSYKREGKELDSKQILQ